MSIAKEFRDFINRGSVVDLAEEVWERVFRVNLTGPFLVMKHVIPVMQRQFEETGEGGSIINISSIASIRHLGISYVTYATTKAAMNQMTRTTAVEFAPKKIRVCAINPVIGETGMLELFMGMPDTPENRAKFLATIPLGRMSKPADIANAALFLADPASEFITGVALEVDGGRCV